MNINDYKLGKKLDNFKDFVQEMLNGNILYHAINKEFIKLVDTEFLCCTNEYSNWSRTNLNECAGLGWSVIETKQWFDNIPGHGILCWVSDSDESDHSMLEIVTGIDSDGDFLTKETYWKFATPAKIFEIDTYII